MTSANKSEHKMYFLSMSSVKAFANRRCQVTRRRRALKRQKMCKNSLTAQNWASKSFNFKLRNCHCFNDHYYFINKHAYELCEIIYNINIYGVSVMSFTDLGHNFL